MKKTLKRFTARKNLKASNKLYNNSNKSNYYYIWFSYDFLTDNPLAEVDFPPAANLDGLAVVTEVRENEDEKVSKVSREGPDFKEVAEEVVKNRDGNTIRRKTLIRQSANDDDALPDENRKRKEERRKRKKEAKRRRQKPLKEEKEKKKKRKAAKADNEVLGEGFLAGLTQKLQRIT